MYMYDPESDMKISNLPILPSRISLSLTDPSAPLAPSSVIPLCVKVQNMDPRSKEPFCGSGLLMGSNWTPFHGPGPWIPNFYYP